MYRSFLIATLISSFFFFSSCEKTVNIDIPYEGNRIVINSIINKDSLIYARVTSSSELSNRYTYPTPAGANIALYEDNVFKGNMIQTNIYGKEYFVSGFPSVQGKKYTLKATANGMDAAEGEDVIPAKPFFYGEDFKEITVAGTRTARVVVKINDPAGVKNYYRLRIYSADTNTSATGPRIFINRYNPEYFKIDNLASNAGSDIFGDIDYDQIYFNDEHFDGKEISLTIKLEYYYNTHSHIAPQLASLTRDAYRYLESREKQFNNDGNPFTEAVIVYNNIKGGYGVIGGMADSISVVRKN